MWRNTETTYGLISVLLHWLTALVAALLFVLGLWMVELDYYDIWYKRAPEIHKGIGIILLLTMLFRVVWRSFNRTPRGEPTWSRVEHFASRVVHALLYVTLFAVMVSGYLISTADGRSIDVFGIFQVPATLVGLPNQADFAGQVHRILAYTLISLAGLHAVAALKHHFVDRDRTLLRMLGRKA